MAANARTSILYRKNYKMPPPNLPPLSYLAHALRSGKDMGLTKVYVLTTTVKAVPFLSIDK